MGIYLGYDKVASNLINKNYKFDTLWEGSLSATATNAYNYITIDKNVYDYDLLLIDVGVNSATIDKTTVPLIIEGKGVKCSVRSQLFYLLDSYSIAFGVETDGLNKIGLMVRILKNYSVGDVKLFKVVGLRCTYDADNYNEKSIMTAYCKSRFSMAMPSAYTAYKIPLTDYISCGDRLTFENNGVKIGKGVSQVLVSGSIGLWNSPSSGEFGLQIHNSKGVRLNMGFGNHSDGEIYGMNIPPVLADVSEGDIIYLNVSSSATGTHNFLADDKAVSLTVQVVR